MSTTSRTIRPFAVKPTREFTVRALTPIAEFNEFFGTAFSDEEYDTIGGLLMQEFGRCRGAARPFKSELEFRVVRADRRRIDLLRVITPSAIEPPATDESAS
jgi:magnesium and cobalt transporter